ALRARPWGCRCRAPRSERSPWDRASARSCRARRCAADHVHQQVRAHAWYRELGLLASRELMVRSVDGGHHSSRAAASTSSACPGTLTLRHSRLSTPLSSSRNMLRSTPLYLRPYRLFSFHTPKSWHRLRSSSESRSNGNCIFALNFSCDSTLSGETPTTIVPAFLNAG